MTLTAKVPKVLHTFASFFSQNKVISLAFARINITPHKLISISSGINLYC